MFKASFLFAFFTYQIVFCGGFTLQNSDLLQNYLEIQNLSQQTVQKWQHNVVIPSYITEFLEKIPPETLQQSPLFEGVEDACKYQVLDWLNRLKPEHWADIFDEKDKWVLQMIDAWGKPIPEGLLAGHTSYYGDFDECVETEAKIDEFTIPDGDKAAKSFDGLYCTSYLIPVPTKDVAASRNFTIQESLSLKDFLIRMMTLKGIFPLIPSIGTCHPNTCTQSDIQNLLTNGFNLFLGNSDITIIAATLGCIDRHKPPLNAAAIAVIVLLALLVAVALIAGIIDYWQTHYKPESQIVTSKAFQYLKAFSMYTNTIKLLGTRRSAEDLGCLHGIRFLSTAWVVLGHTYGMFLQGPQWNRVDINNMYKDWTQMMVMNATFSVDTFFVMSGMLATYNILKMLEKTQGRLNVPMLYLHRYIRLTPTYAILIGIAATLLKYMGNGPGWWQYVANEKYCQDNWWTNLLYINNLKNTGEMCNGESWYLANDMQFFILLPLIVYPMWKWEVMGSLLLVIYTIMSCIAPVLVVRYAHTVPGAFMTRTEAMTGFIEIYQRPWSRINTFLVGVWLGWHLHKTKGQRVTIHKALVLLLWIASTVIAIAVIFGVFKWFDPDYDIPTVAGYFYAGLGRFAWAVVVSWVIFACLKGYGGPVNEFLSWSAFMPLGRLCFCVYLTSFHLQGLFHNRLTLPIKWDMYTVVNIYFAHMVMSYFVGFLCTLLFESPFIVLQKLVFEGPAKGTNPSKVTQKNNEDQEKANR